MSYLDDEIIDDFKKINIKITILTKVKHDLMVENISQNIPFSVTNIAWNLLKDSIYLGVATSQTSMDALAEKITHTTKADIIIIGDATDEAYSIGIKQLSPALRIFSTIPQHTYITQESLDWIAGISFEGYIYFCKLQPPKNTIRHQEKTE
jgi:hypothetical protein